MTARSSTPGPGSSPTAILPRRSTKRTENSARSWTRCVGDSSAELLDRFRYGPRDAVSDRAVVPGIDAHLDHAKTRAVLDGRGQLARAFDEEVVYAGGPGESGEVGAVRGREESVALRHRVLTERCEDLSAPVVDDDHREIRRLVPGGPRERSQIVEVRQVADERERRTDARRRQPDRGRDEAVDPTGPAVADDPESGARGHRKVELA